MLLGTLWGTWQENWDGWMFSSCSLTSHYTSINFIFFKLGFYKTCAMWMRAQLQASFFAYGLLEPNIIVFFLGRAKRKITKNPQSTKRTPWASSGGFFKADTWWGERGGIGAAGLFWTIMWLPWPIMSMLLCYQRQ